MLVVETSGKGVGCGRGVQGGTGGVTVGRGSGGHRGGRGMGRGRGGDTPIIGVVGAGSDNSVETETLVLQYLPSREFDPHLDLMTVKSRVSTE